MKALAFLLAFMTLILSVTPCCVGESHCVEEMAIECTEHSDAEQDTPHPNPPCSPYYACGNCLGFVYQPGSSLTLCFLFFTEQDFNSFYVESLSVSHLHPPQKPPIQIQENIIN